MASKRRRKQQQKEGRELEHRMDQRREVFNDIALKLAATLVVLLVAAGAIWYLVYYEPGPDIAEPWRLQDSDNPENYHESADYYESGRPTLLEFLQTDCPHCNNQVPTMNDIHGDYLGRIDLLAIGGFRLGNSVDSLADLRDFKSEHQVYWPHLYDSTGELMSDYGFSSYPSFALVVDGQVVWSGSGEISYDSLAGVLDQYVEPEK